MDFQIVYAKVLELITLCNSIISNGKKIDELQVQSSLNSSSKIHVSRNGTSESITVSQLMDAFGNSNTDRLLFIGNIPPISSNVLTIPPAGWIIDGVNYSTSTDTSIGVPFAATDFTRIDIIVADDNGVIYSIQGNESGGIAVAPAIPDNTIYITQVIVTDSTIGDPDVPITGFDFIRKDEKTEIIDASSGTIDFTFVDQRAICVLTGSVTIIQTIDLDTTTIYQNKKYAFKNYQSTSITFEHLSSGGSFPYQFKFPNEVDFVLQPNEVIEFLAIKTTGLFLEFIGKTNFEIDNVNGLQAELDLKLDAADYNDRFKGKYTSLANLQSAHPTSNDGDYAIVDAGSGTDALEYIWDSNEGWVKGNATGASTTDALPEGSTNLYWTPARGLALVLSGLSAASGTFTSSDTLLTAFGKIKYLIDNIATTYQAILTDVNFGSFINGLTGKTTPVDADSLSIVDSADSNKQKKVSLTNFKAYLKTYFDTLYQTILVSGTNIKTINGSSLLGSGDLTAGEDIQQSSWHPSIFNCAHQIVGALGGYAANGGNIANDINSPTALPGFMNFLCYSSGTSANGGYRYITISANGGTAIKTQPGLTVFGSFCIYDNSSADTLIRMGFGSSTNMPTDHTNGIYMEITGSTALFKSASAGTRTSTSSATLTYSTALSSEIPYYFMIEVISSSLVNVKIVKHDGTVMLNTTLTSNIPASSAIMHCSVMGCIQTAGTNRNILGISRIGFGVKKPTWLNSF